MRPLTALETSTLTAWRDLFNNFWLRLGRSTPPQEHQAEAYWKDLKGFPEFFLTTMLDDFLSDGAGQYRFDLVRPCPTSADMAARCRQIASDYTLRYQAQQNKDAAGGTVPVAQKVYARAMCQMAIIFLKANLPPDVKEVKKKECSNEIGRLWNGPGTLAERESAITEHITTTAAQYGVTLRDWPGEGVE